MATATWIGAAPEIAISSPADASQFDEGATVLVTGQALPGPSQGAIVAVTVDGVAVDALDAAGNFFATVAVNLGQKTLEFTAVDQFGQSALATLILFGVPVTGEIDFGQLQDITTLGMLAYRTTTFNRATQRLHTDVELTNVGDDSLAGPVLAVYDPVRPLSVDLANPDNALADGRPFVSFDDELPPSGLPTGITSSSIRLAFDNQSRSRFDFNVTLLALGNSAPTFTSAPITEAVVGVAYQYAAVATDADGDLLAFDLEAAPNGMSVNAATGIIAWTPVSTQEGIHQVDLTVSDGRGGTSRQSFQVAALLDPTNRPPRFRSAPITQINSGEDYSYAPDVLDPDGDVLLFSFDASPAGATINPATGQVTFTSPADGTYDFSIRADDGQGASAVQTYVLSVGAPPANQGVPQILSTPRTDAVVDSLYLYPTEAEDPDGDVLTFSLLASPSGMQINPATGRIDWTPTAAQLGAHAVLLLANDGKGGIASQSLTIVVADVPPNRAPTIDSTPTLIATQDQLYSYDITAQDPDGDTLTFELSSGPSGMSINSSTGELTWTPTAADLGAHAVELRAVDPFGAAAVQSYDVEVRGTNLPPEITSSPVTQISAGGVYRYDVKASDTEDGVTFSLVTSPADMTMSPRSRIIFWKTDLADLGDHSIAVRATDDRGLFAEQSYTLTVSPDTTAPLVNVRVQNTVINFGDTVRIDVEASDDVEVASIALEIDGVPVALDQNNGTFFTPASPGLPAIVATAVDTSGNVGTASPVLRVLDPSDTEGPLVEITAPAFGDVITYLTDITGTVTDPNLEFYRLQYALAGTDEFITFHEQIFLPSPSGGGAGGRGVVNALLGTFDPTLLPNDHYEIRVFAQDVSGNQTFESMELSVEGQAKLGNFRLEFTDLEISLAGIPIQINRVYDTLDANQSGDFGFGWSLALYAPRIRETVRISPAEQAGVASLFGANPFRQGTRVYLNNADGRRVGFTFDPVPEPGLLGTIWRPRFTADPEGNETRLLYDERGNVVSVTDPLGGVTTFAYDSDDNTISSTDALGFTTSFTYDDRGNPTSVTDALGNTWSSTYNNFNDVTAATDPLGRTVTYQYDGRGNLIEFTNATGTSRFFARDASGRVTGYTNYNGNTTTYVYGTGPLPLEIIHPDGSRNHRQYNQFSQLTRLIDENGNETNYSYDATGKPVLIRDAQGNVVTLQYDAHLVTSITDPLGRSSHFEYDAADRRVREIDPLGGVSEFQYDRNNRLVRPTDALGRATINTYDANGQLVSVTDPLANVSTFQYDATGNRVGLTNANGHTTTFEYDAVGRLVRQTDALGGVQSFTYDAVGNMTSRTDQNGHITQFAYDALDRRTTEIDALSGTTLSTYDPEGNLVSITDANNHTTSFTYDNRNRLVRRVDPTGAMSEFAYDAVDNQVLEIDPLGQTTTFVYDALNRLIASTDANVRDRFAGADHVIRLRRPGPPDRAN
jgi:YD repeat-containing protein